MLSENQAEWLDGAQFKREESALNTQWALMGTKCKGEKHESSTLYPPSLPRLSPSLPPLCDLQAKLQLHIEIIEIKMIFKVNEMKL